jgi:uncharacterized membrane protein
MNDAHRTLLSSNSRLVLSGCLCVIVLLFLAAPALSADVTLAWDPNSEADLEGYGVYFKQGASGPPFDLFGYVTLSFLAAISFMRLRMGCCGTSTRRSPADA